ncbi:MULTISPECIES: GbsR/MarR family transcriptional regulator [unclassified Paenibacillus]|uniref:GbsR/MarR family transcriptional regulator n=1 Tax=unclassified Paenibacillus TaxID=185978 RepID=UPI00278B6B4F|nr:MULTISPECIES: GbsR/MarR family transcriptional regulator [unclassified Paenibacillus]MDQ0903502.1 DNA-binding transcriptional regulator GbsR (MarR family) [Paenibacillus sp. V4I7]MDQ0918020.1 DNA-binding transcriptional regulator GbsR (MarR family) [Paenibacillus sp. V4I5]
MEHIQGINSEQEVIIQKARKRVIESIGKNMDLYGITQSIGHLYGLLFFQNSPMTLDEMGEAMEMSKTSMSTGVRTLVDLKMVNKVWEKGSRKDLYEVEMDWFQTFADYFGLKWRKALEINLSSLRKSKVELLNLYNQFPHEISLQEVLKVDLEKIDEAIRYYTWLDRLIDSFETGDIFSLVPKDPPKIND